MTVSHHVEPSPSPWDRERLLFGTGRDAIRALLRLGMRSKGWKRLWIPSYFCQTVVQSIVETGINVQCYNSWYPGRSKEEDRPQAVTGDVVLEVNYFGLTSQSSCVVDTKNATAVIEDHTHDPWSPWAFKSKAEYCIASLRKVLPIPDGAVLWSPSELSLPEPPPLTEEHEKAAGTKLEAMKLKAEYLAGSSPDNESYRKLFASGEKHLSGSSVSAMSAWSQEHLDHFPVSSWRKIGIRTSGCWHMLCQILHGLMFWRLLKNGIQSRSQLSCSLKRLNSEISCAMDWSLKDLSGNSMAIGRTGILNGIPHCSDRGEQDDCYRYIAT